MHADTPDSDREKPLRAEIARLNKTIASLIERAERSTSIQGSDFNLFQTTLMLEKRVNERTAALNDALAQNEATNRALRQSARQLEATQTEQRKLIEELSQAKELLVQSEKLAALGSLVAGVAHELNTPLGNALVAATALHDQMRELQQRIDGGNLRKTDLTEFMRVGEEGCQLIERSTCRAVTLVTNLKQVTDDQTSAQRREFNLLQTVQEVLATLTPTLNSQHHSLTVDIPDNLVLNSYPESLEQAITQIVTNAMIHAFPPGQPGRMLISASPTGEDGIIMLLWDDGVGIPADKQGRVFDPFFTTRLGQGGSGLGLYIVYNIVTGRLGGHIQLVSTPGTGTCFVIRIPREAPCTGESPPVSPSPLVSPSPSI